MSRDERLVHGHRRRRYVNHVKTMAMNRAVSRSQYGCRRIGRSWIDSLAEHRDPAVWREKAVVLFERAAPWLSVFDTAPDRMHSCVAVSGAGL